MLISFAGVTLPLFGFLPSGFMVPEWKGACPNGWLDCFIVGKTALTPLALWATAALYEIEVVRVENRMRLRIVIGIFYGALVSIGCLIFSVIWLLPENGMSMWLILVPGYVAVWYTVRAAQLIAKSDAGFWTCLLSAVGSIPFWLASGFWSMLIYQGLPDKQPQGCFIVTAAGRGHESITGPFAEIERNGRRLRANRQLLTFWELEARWKSNAPLSHAVFRGVYNRLGPVVAAQIRWRWLADLTCVALKPAELCARWINCNAKGQL
jgi:hypothetical protein